MRNRQVNSVNQEKKLLGNKSDSPPKMMFNLITWTVLVSLFEFSHQACSSTVAITTCTWDTVKPNQPIRINDYRTYLSFPRGNLEHIPSGTFKFLPQVTSLQLSFNKIKSLDDDAFVGLQNLNELVLYDNQLTMIGKNVFRHCPNIQKLHLGMNKISTIHDKAFENLVNLKFLNLGFNSLKTVPLAVNTATKLSILKLSNNAIDSLKANAFSNLNKLEELLISDNKITSIEKDALKGLVNLKHVDVKSNYLTDLNVEELLNDAKALQLVSLSINDFKCAVLTQIIDKFRKKFVEVARGVSKSPNNVNGIGCKI